LESLFIGIDKVPPAVIEDLVERIVAEDAGTVSHSDFPADMK